MKPLLIVMSGLPFSGKSTLAQGLGDALKVPVLNYDDEIYAKHKHEVPNGTSAAKEFDMIESIARKYLAKRLKSGESVIFDDLGLQRDDRDRLHKLATAYGAQYVLVFLDTPLHLIEERRKANMKTKTRNHIGDVKMKLNISLYQPPGADENPIIVRPETSIEEVLNAIRISKT